MQYNLPNCLKNTLVYEGGYVNNPKDPGGATNMGITLATLQSWRNKKCSIDDVKNLTLQEATAIYNANYWRVIGGDYLPAGVDQVVFDFAVNSGVLRAKKTLQSILGVTPDGVFGDQTRFALEKQDSGTLIDEYCRTRLQFLQSLPTFTTFGKGWTARVIDVRNKAHNMI